MVIFDTKNNYNGQIKGMLYLSIMDVDYVVSKYGIDTLKRTIPLDYAECFEDELRERTDEGKFSIQYYPVLSLGIETDNDEKLLDILSDEVTHGNIFTKKELQALSKEELEQRISEISYVEQIPERATIEEIYKLRSYQMAKFIIENIERANRSVDIAYQTRENGCSLQEKKALEDSSNIRNILISLGLSDDIEESDYFVKEKQKTHNLNNKLGFFS